MATIWTRRNVAATFGGTAVVVVFGFLTSIILARSLGPENRGLLLSATFWPALLAGLTNLSINESTIYHIARSSREGQIQRREVYDQSALVLQFFVAVASAAFTAATLFLIYRKDERSDVLSFVLFGLFFASLSVLDQHFKAVLQGRGAIWQLSLQRLVQPLSYVATLLILLILGRLQVGEVLVAILMALALSTAVGAIVAGFGKSEANREEIRVLVKTGIKFHQANALLYAASEADKFIVLTLLDHRSAGIYAVALAIGSIGTALVVQSMNTFAMREMATQTNDVDRRLVLTRTVRLASLLLMIINGAAAGLCPLAIPLVFGQQFASAVPIALLLLVNGVLKGTRQVTDALMRATHVTSIGMMAEVSALGFILTLGSIGTIEAGLIGFAVGAVAAQAAALAIAIFLTCRRLRVSVASLWPLRPLVLLELRNRIITNCVQESTR